MGYLYGYFYGKRNPARFGCFMASKFFNGRFCLLFLDDMGVKEVLASEKQAKARLQTQHPSSLPQEIALDKCRQIPWRCKSASTLP
jgi:hypothetical protein